MIARTRHMETKRKWTIIIYIRKERFIICPLSLGPRVQGHNSGEIHWVHVLGISLQNLPHYNSVCPL